MVDKELLGLLVCPEDHTPLHPAEEPLIARLNQAIQAGTLTNRAGRSVDKPLEAGLVRRDGKLLYPIVDGIPVMLVEEAIPLGQISGYSGV